MSIKIFNAYASQHPIDNFDLFSEAQHIRQIITHTLSQSLYNEYVQYLIRYIDQYSVLGNVHVPKATSYHPENPYLSTILAMHAIEALDKTPVDMHRASFYFYNGRRALLRLFFTHNPNKTSFTELQQNLSTLGWTDYHYQNSTDKPHELSTGEWTQRRQDWENLFDHDPTTTFESVGLGQNVTINCTEAIENIEAAYPKSRERAEFLDMKYLSADYRLMQLTYHIPEFAQAYEKVHGDIPIQIMDYNRTLSEFIKNNSAAQVCAKKLHSIYRVIDTVGKADGVQPVRSGTLTKPELVRLAEIFAQNLTGEVTHKRRPRKG